MQLRRLPQAITHNERLCTKGKRQNNNVQQNTHVCVQIAQCRMGRCHVVVPINCEIVFTQIRTRRNRVKQMEILAWELSEPLRRLYLWPSRPSFLDFPPTEDGHSENIGLHTLGEDSEQNNISSERIYGISLSKSKLNQAK